jgi:uncharacterized repeat protein (TIGR01451 family)
MSTFLALTLLGLTTTAQAAPNVTIRTTVEKEQVVIIDGTQQVRFAPADAATPGEILRFTLMYANTGDEAATGVVLDNPIPTGAVYLTDSATADGADELLSSIDGGASFKQPDQLTATVTLENGRTETRVAAPEQYTHIRWLINRLPAGETGQVSYKALVE